MRALVVTLLLLGDRAAGLDSFNATRWQSLAYVRELLDDSACLWRTAPAAASSLTMVGGVAALGSTTGEIASPCASKGVLARTGFTSPDRTGVTGLFDSSAKGEPTSCEYCTHGAHMIPWLIKRYKVTSLAEVGVCTGMSVANVVQRLTGRGRGEHGIKRILRAALTKYYMVDPWDGDTHAVSTATASAYVTRS